MNTPATSEDPLADARRRARALSVAEGMLLALGFAARFLSLGVFALQLSDSGEIPWHGLRGRMRLALHTGR